MKTLIVAIITLGVTASAASAETFTFTSTSTLQNAVVAPVKDAKPVQAAFITGTTKATYASGRATTNTFQCADWSSTPGSLFDAYAACTYTEPGGDTASIVAGCDYANKEQTEADCVAGLNGLDGPHKGKSGTMSWHAKTSADGKTGSSAGTGQWND